MRAMKKGDLAFFYHSGEEKSIVGIVKIVQEAHPDSTDPSGQWECVDVAAVADLAKPVSLAEIKATPALKTMVLVRNSRLSVQPVTEPEWRKLCAMGGVTDPSRA
jgi:predicted RNA-binding protein with PUA-like domain